MKTDFDYYVYDRVNEQASESGCDLDKYPDTFAGVLRF